MIDKLLKFLLLYIEKLYKTIYLLKMNINLYVKAVLSNRMKRKMNLFLKKMIHFNSPTVHIVNTNLSFLVLTK